VEATLAWRARKSLIVLAATAWLTGTAGIQPGWAQEPGVLIEGRVLWVAAETMVIAPYVLIPGVATAINVDLSRAHQDEYAGLKTGDAVAVMGEVPPTGDRVIATSIRRLTPS
jgi:hypothetical protein